jgi:4-amino-4-deoxy-L-arabinose transferase-like glycosyltransferase
MRKEIGILAPILLLGLLLRLWGLDFGLPYMYHPDEPNKIAIAQRIFKTGDLNPHDFRKPTLSVYLNALAYVPYYLFGKLRGVFQTPSDILAPTMLAMGVGKTDMPTTMLMGRLITTVFALFSVILVFVLGKQTYGKGLVGLLAALMMAISPSNVNNSRNLMENSFLTCAIIATVWASMNIYQRGRLRDYVLAGIFTGMAASFKYPGAVVILAVPTAHFLREGWAGVKDYRLYLALALAPAAFLLGTPYALLDHNKFLEDILFAFHHYQTGHAGMEGNSLLWYLSYLCRIEGLVALLAVIEIARACLKRHKPVILLSSFPTVYFAFISLFSVRNDRTLLPVTPFLFILASALLIRLYQHTAQLRSRPVRAASTVGLSLITLISLAIPAYHTIADGIRLNTVDSRETAGIWIENNLPPGTKIAVESYTSYVDPARFAVQGFIQMIDQTPDWYVAQGFEYLVFGQGMFRRYYDEPEKYGAEIEQYDKFFDRFQLVRTFTDGGYEIRIYRVAER